jgi:type III secretion system regulator LcrR
MVGRHPKLAGPPDPVRPALEAAGLVLTPRPLYEDHPAGLLAGHAFAVLGLEIVYRLHDPRTVVISFLGRTGARTGLRNPLAGLDWFLDFLKDRPELGVLRVMGLVQTEAYRSAGGLGDGRLERYYTRWLCAHRTRFDGNDFVCLDLADHRPRRRRGGAPTHP